MDRGLHFQAADAESLGRALAGVYGERVKEGLRRAQAYYLVVAPITCTATQWRSLSEHARRGAELCCPTAVAFFKGLEAGLETDIYEALLDFEIYTIELQRRAKVSKGTVSRTRSSSSSSTSSSSGSSGSSSGSSCKGSISLDSSCNKASSPDSVPKKDTSNSPGTDAEETADDAVVASDDAGGPHAAVKEDHAGQPGTMSGRCTGFALVDPDRFAVLAQSADLPPELYGFGDFDSVLHLETPGGGVVVYDSDGRLCPIGLNSAGLGIGVFNLHMSGTSGFEKPSLSVQTMIWELLLGQHTLSSAKEWLARLPLLPMCGSALLLADRTGATTVEFDPDAEQPVVFKDASSPGAPVVRANHPTCESSEAGFGDSAKARRQSELRQKEVCRVLAAWEEQAKAGTVGPLSGLKALRLVGSSKKVRNLTTLACLGLDLCKLELHVEFRERQAATTEEVARMAVQHGLRAELAFLSLMQGAVRKDTGRARTATGERCEHFVRWARHRFSLVDRHEEESRKVHGDAIGVLCVDSTATAAAAVDVASVDPD